jgi:hypothetical protein
MQEPVYCTECDEILKIELPDGQKYAQRVARKQHAQALHGGDMRCFRQIGLNDGMTSGEWKHLQEFIDSHSELEIHKMLKSVETLKTPDGDAFDTINKLLDQIEAHFPEMLQGEVRLLERLHRRATSN